MADAIDKRGKLEERCFSYQTVKDGRVMLYWYQRHVKTLIGKEAQKFLSAIDSCQTEKDAQLMMAKATGNFKRGNERKSD